MRNVYMFAKTVINSHEKDRKAHADEKFRKDFFEIELKAKRCMNSVAGFIRFIRFPGKGAPVLSGCLAVGLVCGSLLWAAPDSALAQGLPQHMVAYMTQSGQTVCPNNWTEAGYAQGRLILGTIDGSKVQVQKGTPAGDLQQPQHVHTFTVTGTIASGSNSSLPTGGDGVDIPRAAGGQVNSSGTTQGVGTSLNLPFMQFLVCEHMVAESPDSTPYGTVAFFNASTCPNNWAPVATADGRFLVPGSAGFATSASWSPANPPTHTHGLQSSFGTQSRDYEAFPSNWVDFANQGTYAVTGTTDPAGPLLPYVSLLVCERTNGFGNSDGVPQGTSIFFEGQECPNDWGVTVGANGRFIIGIGGNGTQGQTFGGDPIGSSQTPVQHDHGFSGVVSPPASAYPGGPTRTGYGRQSYVTTADGSYSGTSSMATTDLPYLIIQSCSYVPDLSKPRGKG
ncbi:hypothetical protein W02_09010 [Nitrospira sp. KM1]|uniref:hypothetical protein n=1 Tax=Nitrospira sp. KM1 TaxID=1936990 RepID=UPI0013A79034|nr:hypothetical protein [Nitrospira sp. KM1]BCA53761.1 hypothetical protein W02_09010 [Nitrospira sp. KM1]